MSNTRKIKPRARATQQATGGVCVGILRPTDVAGRFVRSLAFLLVHDAKNRGHVVRHGAYLDEQSGGNIIPGRNKVVRTFLETGIEWLWLIDADMTFEPDTLDRLMEAADKTTVPIVGGLCFSVQKGDAQEIVPTLYGVGDNKFVRWMDYPPDQLVAVAGTGAACLLIHRSVLEAIAEKFPPPFPFFDNTITGNEWGDSISEDLTFCLRAAHVGFPVHVDTRVKVGHVKTVEVDEPMFRANVPQVEPPAPTYVVIPVKGKHQFTDSLLDQLVAQGGYDQILLYDNASGTPDEYPGHDDVKTIPAQGLSIYQMWNAGIRHAIDKSPRCNIAILNNDLLIGDNFLQNLAVGLRAHPSLMAVSANYDRRDFPELVQAVRGISAGREDGTGGLAGFAFMVRGEMYASGAPLFDEQYEIWYGDTDFTMMLDRADATYGIVKNATVVHIGGGSQTAGDGKERLAAEWKEAAERDRKRFEEKWAPRRVERASAWPGELR